MQKSDEVLNFTLEYVKMNISDFYTAENSCFLSVYLRNEN